MMLGFTSLILIVHCYVAWAAGRLAAPLPRIGRIAVGALVVSTPLLLLLANDAANFDGRCLGADTALGPPCTLGQRLGETLDLWAWPLAIPMLIWLGFYSSSLERAKAEAGAR